MSDTPSTPQNLSYHAPMEMPAPRWSERLNWRIVIFAGVMLFLVGWPLYTYVNETITGGIHDHGSYKEVDLKAMSSFDMDQRSAELPDVPSQFRGLEGQDVLMTGEMWAPQSASDGSLGYFQLVYSKTKCCFSGPPLAQHFVDGNVVKGVQAFYYDIPVKVWGKLHVYMRRDKGGVIKSVYHVDVNKVEPIEN
jgi:hypothetical protein